jgi:spore coat polysaccharide biosynthesis protein SpsF
MDHYKDIINLKITPKKQIGKGTFHNSRDIDNYRVLFKHLGWNTPVSVLIDFKKKQIVFREANINDIDLYFNWINDSLVRKSSYQSNLIDFESHTEWFKSKIIDSNSFMAVFENGLNQKIGQVRIDMIDNTNAIISMSVAKEHREKGYAAKLISTYSDYFLEKFKNVCINAYIKQSNMKSKHVFEKAGFKFSKILVYKKNKSFHYKKIR